MTLASNHRFPRHTHDQFGIGVIAFGAHRSWSGIGDVSADPGDVIMVNPGEMHDGTPLEGAVRGWRMIYLDPACFSRDVSEECAGPVEIVRPVARDPLLARHFATLFACLTGPKPDRLAEEESLLRALMCLLRRDGMRRPATDGPCPTVAKAIRRLDSASESPVSLAELAALSGVNPLPTPPSLRARITNHSPRLPCSTPRAPGAATSGARAPTCPGRHTRGLRRSESPDPRLRSSTRRNSRSLSRCPGLI
jgi:hypothetical protein